MIYIPRTLIVDKGEAGERSIEETEVPTLSGPLLILGEPGIGKTDLTKSLQTSLGARRVTAGTFSRTENFTPFRENQNSPLIIDGLDEITPSGGVPALDEILRKLDRIGRPRFILSCRAADWLGASDRAKIEADYGIKPVTLHIVPFSKSQAKEFLEGFDRPLDANAVLDEIEKKGLNELIGNPLTLGLLAEVCSVGEGLPNTKTDLLENAARLLVREKNPSHGQSAGARARADDLLLSAGAICAHLLLSASIGVGSGNREAILAGFISDADVSALPSAPLALDVLGTRLFRSDGEGRLVPIHRVIAEYLGARWLSRRLDEGLSERRLFQALEFSGGVPSALRGLHAWLAYFNPRVADRCIKTDPYGVLRYGETSRLPAPRARLLLQSLAALAKEDPYFRSEDWGVRAISGLARAELKDEIVGVVRSPDRHFHLSSLLLESLPGSELTQEISTELRELLLDGAAIYAERHHAAEALVAAKLSLDWSSIVSSLIQRGSGDDKRLALEIITNLNGDGFGDAEIADALVAYTGIDEKSEDYISGVDYFLVHKLPGARCSPILDEVEHRISHKPRSPRWTPTYSLAGAIQRLIAKSLTASSVEPAQFWRWIRRNQGRSSYASDAKEKITQQLMQNDAFRREVQRAAISDADIDGGAWMAIVHELPQANSALLVTDKDAVFFLEELAMLPSLDLAKQQLWTDLITSQRTQEGFSEAVSAMALLGVQKHPTLAKQWSKFENAPEPKWVKENRRREALRKRQQLQKFALHRANFEKHLAQIEAGEAVGALIDLSKAYLNRYSDLNHDAPPLERIREWVGQPVAEAASKGFLKILDRADLPNIDAVMEVRNEGKHWTIEPAMLCGAAELVSNGKSLQRLPSAVAESLLAIWWDMPEFGSTQLGKDIERELEEAVLASEADIEHFLTAYVEPQIRSGKDHVSGLYRMPREPRFSNVAVKLALKWLQTYPTAKLSVQRELLLIALHEGAAQNLEQIVRTRLANPPATDAESNRMWLAAAFIIGLADVLEKGKALAGGDRDMLWSIKDLMSPDRVERRGLLLGVSQLEFIISEFAHSWPVVARPRSSWSGANNPWDASDYLAYCINSLGAVPSVEASSALERLEVALAGSSYSERVKHVKYSQRRLRRDNEYIPLSFEQAAQVLADAHPGNIDDLKALLMDRLEVLQKYLRDADTDGWEAFWEGQKPKIENVCRDRILDGLRPRMPTIVDLLPETLMPEKNRSDIIAIYNGLGVPVEVKGQWHPDVWHASETQLDDKYGRDWRADGRGIYLVLWFGNVPGKNLPGHPDGLDRPQSPSELRDMLAARLKDECKGRIEIAVIDVAKPTPI